MWTKTEFKLFRCIIIGRRELLKLKNILNEIASRIIDSTETPVLDAQVLLASITGQSRSWVLAHPEIELNSKEQGELEFALDQLGTGVPLPYIIGNWEFYGLEFIISKDVLIPRPETELLVDKALAWLKANPKRRRLIDMGTGSGCIAVALAVHIPDLFVIASDISEKALYIAQQNAHKFDVAGRIEFICGNLWEAGKLEKGYAFSLKTDRPSPGADLITANLPYIPSSILHDLKVYGREPELALDGGFDGLVVIRQFLKSAMLYLKPGGLILMELESSLGKKASTLGYDFFPEAGIHLHQDLSGHERLLEIRP